MKNVLRNSFGLDFKMNQIQPPKGLPFYMTNNRKFYELISDTISFIAVELSYEDKNFLCKPYLEAAMQSKIQGLSFFSGGGGLDIGAQMAGIKVLTS